MEKQRELLKNYFALINLKMFCEKYGMSYDNVRKVLNGERPMAEKFFRAMLDMIGQHERERKILFTQLTDE